MERNFSQRLYELRSERGQTLEQVSNGVNQMLGTKISKGQLSRFEKGENKASIDNAIALSIYFGVSLDYMIGLSDDRSIRQMDRILAYAQRLKELNSK
jgi:transcriptional regulator with XRE-family HTH domain